MNKPLSTLSLQPSRADGIFATKYAYPNSAIPGGSPWSGVARRMSSGNVVRRATFPKKRYARCRERALVHPSEER